MEPKDADATRDRNSNELADILVAAHNVVEAEYTDEPAGHADPYLFGTGQRKDRKKRVRYQQKTETLQERLDPKDE